MLENPTTPGTEKTREEAASRFEIVSKAQFHSIKLGTSAYTPTPPPPLPRAPRNTRLGEG